MAHVREPEGVDLVVGPSILTEKDKLEISEAIARYKKSKRKTKKAVISGQKKAFSTAK
jgi:hypothetical protein